MKTLLLAATAIAFAALVNLSPAWAADSQNGASRAPHYEWQYHYVGHHPHYQGYWALVK